ncbi:hypothetical protein KY285_030165 [Solanum tuberosum]|nr:hypothetical protein KY285_030165 [Solanum tuberosum]
MKLRSGFESVHSNLMNHDPSPSLDVCFRELLHEDKCLVTQNAFKKENDVTVAFATQGQALTPEMVQQMIVSAFSTLGLQGSGVEDDNCERT